MAKLEWTSLMDEDEFRFVPLEGQFDTALVEDHVAGLGFAFRDEAKPDTFVVCATAEGRDAFQKRRAENPDAAFPPLLVVSIRADEIVVSPARTEELVETTGELLKWLARQKPSRVTCDGADVSDYVLNL